MKELLGIIFIIVIIFLVRGCVKSKLEEQYSVGYEDGYSDGQLEPLYPEDITNEYVKQDPERYCGEYAKQKIDSFILYLRENAICYDK